MATIYKLGSRGAGVKAVQKALAGAGYRVIADGIFGEVTEEAVKRFQKSKGLCPDGIVGPATLAYLLPSAAKGALGLKRSKRTIREIIVHCTATPEQLDCTVDDIRRWHKARGFSDIGYHYVIYLDGTIHTGRDIDIIGAHCTGHNAYSVGVAYVGGVARDGKTPKDTRNDLQKASLLRLLKELKSLYPNAVIYSHRDFANKACPSFDATREYRTL